MKPPKQALLLIGSAKKPHSTSESLGTYLLERLRGHQVETDVLFLSQMLRSNERQAALLAAAGQADLLVLAFPLYIDSLPYLVIRALELIAQHRQGKAQPKGQRLICIANCGFPEAHHTDMAIAICRQFARETGFEWAGGLALGGGQAIDGLPLSQRQGLTRNVVAALTQAAEALAQGQAIPQEAAALMARPLIPKWLYLLAGGMGWKRRAKHYGAQNKLKDRPYERGRDL